MEDLSKRCFLCMEKKDEANVCPHCGPDKEISQDEGLLPLGCLLAGRYYIGKARRKNSEGATYIAFDLRENRKCSVREFYPEALAGRDADGLGVKPLSGSENTFADCLAAFGDLWGKLGRLRGLTALITVYDLFTENNTAYAVYEETEDYTLRDYLLSSGGGYISWEQARILFMPVLSTIGTLHTSGVIHRGIKPDAFLMTQEGKLRLTDFSIPQAKLCYGDLDADVAEGYAPLEIYTERYEVGPWTDVYAFTAVLYRTLIGSTPISAPVRAENDQMMIPAKFAEQLPPYVINAIINGMQIDPNARTRNVEQLRSNLSASPRAVSASAGIYSGQQRTAAPSRANSVYNPGVRRSASGLVDPPSDVRRPAQPPRQQPRPQTPNASPARAQNAPSLKEDLRSNMSPAAQQLLLEQTKKAKSRRNLIIVLCVLLVIAVIGLCVFIIGMQDNKNEPQTTTELETVVVPDFTGAMYDTVATDSYYSTYFHFVKVEEYSAAVPKGQIMSQSVLPTTQVNRGAEVILYISAGPKTMTVEDVAGKTYEEALAILVQQGLVCERATKYNDGTHTPDTVAETFPAAGTRITQGDKITVILWGALEETTAAPTEATVHAGESSPTQGSSGFSSLLGGLLG